MNTRAWIAVAIGLAFTGWLLVAGTTQARADGREAWTHCVTTALVTGTATDANVQACDAEYAARTGDTATIWLWCPGPVERGGCEARTGPLPE